MSDLIKTLKSSETGDNVYPNIVEDNIPSGAVKTAKINDGAVTTAKIDDESVTTAKLGTLAVTTPKIDTGAVTTPKLDDSAVTTIKLNDGAVTSAKIGNSAVTNAKINDGAVSYDKLATALKNLIDGKASQTDLNIVSNALTSHTTNTSNPHSVTASQVGLGNVDNTSDANKPISTATQSALDGKQSKIDSSHKLDADLVDDSTSTNKFTNASNLSKLSGIESGAEVNTIESISVNGTPVTPDANRNVNIATGGGGSTLYLHEIVLEFTDINTQDYYGTMLCKILSTSNTPITTIQQIADNYSKIISFNGGYDSDRSSEILMYFTYPSIYQNQWTTNLEFYDSNGHNETQCVVAIYSSDVITQIL